MSVLLQINDHRSKDGDVRLEIRGPYADEESADRAGHSAVLDLATAIVAQGKAKSMTVASRMFSWEAIPLVPVSYPVAVEITRWRDATEMIVKAKDLTSQQIGQKFREADRPGTVWEITSIACTEVVMHNIDTGEQLSSTLHWNVECFRTDDPRKVIVRRSFRSNVRLIFINPAS